MAGKSASILIRILGDADSAKAAIGETESKFASLGKNLAKVGAAVGAAGVAMGVVFGKAAIGAASDLDESMSKVNVVFGDAAEAVQEWSKGTAKAFGQSRGQALEAVGTYGNLFKAFGLNSEAAQGMSTSMVELAADLASFNNTSIEEALTSLQSGISGETEPLKKYGIVLSDVRLKEEALRLGLIKTTKDALTPAAKAQASYSLIMKDSALAQGDFARTSDGLANKQRIMAAQFEDVKAKIGSALLPAMSAVVGIISDKVIPLFEMAGEGVEYFIGGLTGEFTNEGTGILLFLNQLGMKVGEFIDAFKQAWPQIRETVVQVFDALVAKGQELYAWFAENILPGLRAAFQEVVEWIRRNWDDVANVFREVAEFIGKVVDTFVTVIMPALVDAFTSVVRFMRDDFWPAAQAVFGWLQEHVPPIIQAVVTAANWLWQNVLQPFANFMRDTMLPAAQTTFGWLRDNVPPIIQTVIDVSRTLWNDVLSPLASFLKAGFKIAFEVAKVAFDVFKTAAEAVGSAVQALWDVGVDVVAFFRGAWSTGWGIAASAINALKVPLQAIIDFISRVISLARTAFDEIRALNGNVNEKTIGKDFGKNLPQRAVGDNNWVGGWVNVHERGGEILNLPRGTQIIPHDISMEIARSVGQGGPTLTIGEQHFHQGVDVQAAMHQIMFHLAGAA